MIGLENSVYTKYILCTKRTTCTIITLTDRFGGVMMKPYTINASDVRKDWGRFIDDTVRVKPQFVKRSRDEIVTLSMDVFKDLLSAYPLTAQIFEEDNGSITVALDQIDLIANGENSMCALEQLADDLIEYSEDFYKDFSYWSLASNRKKHIPYILNVMSQDSAEDVRGLILCQHGKN